MITTEFKTRNGWHRDRLAPPAVDEPREPAGLSAAGLAGRLRGLSAAHPAVWIAGAVTLGVILGCIIKRR